jgi:Skp family chaperone for outer membrane proteins
MTEKHVLRTCGLLALAWVAQLGAGALQAQEPAKGAPPSMPRIAVIDMGKVSSDSLLGKSYAAELDKLKNEIEAERTKKQNDLTKLDAAVKALQDEIEKQGQVLSPEALEKKRQDLIKRGRERQAFLEDGQQEIERLTARAQEQAQKYNQEFQTKLRPYIDAVVKDKNIDLLIDSQVTITVNKALDVSQDVIVKADDAERAAKPAAAKPATPAKPSGN